MAEEYVKQIERTRRQVEQSRALVRETRELISRTQAIRAHGRRLRESQFVPAPGVKCPSDGQGLSGPALLDVLSADCPRRRSVTPPDREYHESRRHHAHGREPVSLDEAMAGADPFRTAGADG